MRRQQHIKMQLGEELKFRSHPRFLWRRLILSPLFRSRPAAAGSSRSAAAAGGVAGKRFARLCHKVMGAATQNSRTMSIHCRAPENPKPAQVIQVYIPGLTDAFKGEWTKLIACFEPVISGLEPPSLINGVNPVGLHVALDRVLETSTHEVVHPRRGAGEPPSSRSIETAGRSESILSGAKARRAQRCSILSRL